MINSATSSKSETSAGSNSRMPLLAVVLIALMGFIVYKDYLLFNHAFFFVGVGSDTLNYNYPFSYNAAAYIAAHGLPSWSFNFGIGQNIFPFFLRDPFDIFVYLAGKNNIYHAAVFKEYLKVVASGLVFFYYLRMLRLSDITALLGSLLFSFCGFMVIGGCWYIFSFEAFNMALLLIGFERMFTMKKWLLFPIAIALIGISQPFNLYVYGIFMTCYALLRHIQTDQTKLKQIAATFAQMGGMVIAGILLSGPFFLENAAQLLNSPRGSGINSYFHTLSSSPLFQLSDNIQLGTGVMRFFANNLSGMGNSFSGWKNYLEAPAFYCGLPCLLLMPQVFSFVGRRMKITFFVLLVLWLIPLIFPWFRLAFWLFTGNYYRAYAFFVSFFMLYYALHAFELIVKHQKINTIVLFISVVILYLLLNYPFFPAGSALNFHRVATPGHDTYLFVSVMLAVYAVTLYFMSRENVRYAKYILIALVVGELTWQSRITVNNMDALPAADLAVKRGYNDCTVEAVHYIDSVDKSFFRVDKRYYSSPTWFFSLNDGMAQGFRGTSQYSSFNQQYYIRYLQLMGIADRTHEDESRWAAGLNSRPLLESGNSVKYILAKQSDSFLRTCCDSLTTTGDIKIFRNRFVLPFGYSYDHYILKSTFDGLSNEQKDLIALQACVLNDEDASSTALHVFPLTDTIATTAFDTAVFRKWSGRLSQAVLAVNSFTETRIQGTVHADSNRVMYLSLPYDKGWHISVDGKEQNKILLSAGMTGLFISPGTHHVDISYRLPLFQTGLLLSVAGVVLIAGLFFYQSKKGMTV